MRTLPRTRYRRRIGRQDWRRRSGLWPRRPGRVLVVVALIAGGLAVMGPLLGQPARAAATQQQPASVLVIRLEGPITPVAADHLREGVRAAERQRHVAFVVELDTPGGLDGRQVELAPDRTVTLRTSTRGCSRSSTR